MEDQAQVTAIKVIHAGLVLDLMVKKELGLGVLARPELTYSLKQTNRL